MQFLFSYGLQFEVNLRSVVRLRDWSGGNLAIWRTVRKIRFIAWRDSNDWCKISYLR